MNVPFLWIRMKENCLPNDLLWKIVICKSYEFPDEVKASVIAFSSSMSRFAPHLRTTIKLWQYATV
jgi:hypothetical protein